MEQKKFTEHFDGSSWKKTNVGTMRGLEDYKTGVSPSTQVFCRTERDRQIKDAKAIEDGSATGYQKFRNSDRRGFNRSQRKRIEFKPDKEQAISEFSQYNPFFLIFPILNFIINFVSELSGIFTWLIKESFNATLDILIPKNMSGKIGLFPGTKYCINKVYWRYFLTMLCPPAGVFMSYGLRGWVQIIICCVLSLLYYIPGLIYAIIVMNRSDVAEAIENAAFGSCDGSSQSFFISSADNQTSCNRDIGDKCFPGKGKPEPGDPTSLSCCIQPKYNPQKERWEKGDTGIQAVDPDGNAINSYEEGETICKVLDLKTVENPENSGTCVFKKTGRPSK